MPVRRFLTLLTLMLILSSSFATLAKTSSYAPVDITEEFSTILARIRAAKPKVQALQTELLRVRYDLADRPMAGVAMSRCERVQSGARTKLPAGPAGPLPPWAVISLYEIYDHAQHKQNGAVMAKTALILAWMKLATSGTRLQDLKMIAAPGVK